MLWWYDCAATVRVGAVWMCCDGSGVPGPAETVRACADLVTTVHSESVSSELLAAYLGLLTAPDPPLVMLLRGRCLQAWYSACCCFSCTY